ncbi:MAG: flagellar protein [Lachnospiraceae bacterium]|nr:flagellar protein [Lachnospiraceae bacterium]
MNISGNMMASIEQMSDRIRSNAQVSQTNGAVESTESNLSFKDYIQSASVKFSKHANERLNTRNINLDNSQMERLEKGMIKAREKGMRDPLVMIDNIAFIVNIKSNTVVTALGDVNEAVFTNIDGAVIS